MSKRASLSTFTTSKSGGTLQPKQTPKVSASVKEATKPIRKGQTLRLAPDAWRQLKFMAVEQDRPAHDLLLEAVNDLFQKYGKPALS